MASSFTLMPIYGFTQGIQPVISYNYGAGRNDRVRKATLVSCTVCTVYAVIICAVLLIAPQIFAGIFSRDMDVISVTIPLLRIYVFTANSITAIYIAEPLSDIFAFMVTVSLFIMTRKSLSQKHDVEDGFRAKIPERELLDN